jgi:hypothetical protein
LTFTLKEQGKKTVVAVMSNEAFMMIAVLSFTIAVSTGLVTLVNALTSLTAFFVLFFTVILSTFYPNILKEEISNSTVLAKFFAITLMFAGTLLIT